MAHSPIRRECITLEEKACAMVQTMCSDMKVPCLIGTHNASLVCNSCGLAFQTSGDKSSYERDANMNVQLNQIVASFKDTLLIVQNHCNPEDELIVASVVASCNPMATDQGEIGGHIVVRYSTLYTERRIASNFAARIEPSSSPVAASPATGYHVPENAPATPLESCASGYNLNCHIGAHSISPPEPLLAEELRATARSQVLVTILDGIKNAASEGWMRVEFPYRESMGDDTLRALREKGFAARLQFDRLYVSWGDTKKQ